MCHTSCALLDAGPLGSWLAEIKNWLDANPYDVVTILLVNSDNAAASDLDGEFGAAAIKSYAFTPTTTSTALSNWPTLNDLIVSGKRLVTFVADIVPSTAAPYLLNEFTYVFENPFSVLSLSNFTCTPDRPTVVQGQTSAAVQSGRLPLMNHFLDSAQAFGIEVPDIGNITVTNAISGPVGNLGDTAANCTVAYGRAPSFILVDFFEHASSIDTADRLNGITPVGRASPPTSGTSGVASSGATRQASSLGFSLVCSYSLITTFLVTTFVVTGI